MALKNQLTKIYLTELKELDFFEFRQYSRENYDRWNKLFANKRVSAQNLDNIFESMIKSHVEQEYYRVTRHNKQDILTEYMDDAFRPELFAYAITNKLLSEEQINNLPFNRAENPASYVVDYGLKNLKDKLRRELLHPDLNYRI